MFRLISARHSQRLPTVLTRWHQPLHRGFSAAAATPASNPKQTTVVPPAIGSIAVAEGVSTTHPLLAELQRELKLPLLRTTTPITTAPLPAAADTSNAATAAPLTTNNSSAPAAAPVISALPPLEVAKRVDYVVCIEPSAPLDAPGLEPPLSVRDFSELRSLALSSDRSALNAAYQRGLSKRERRRLDSAADRAHMLVTTIRIEPFTSPLVLMDSRGGSAGVGAGGSGGGGWSDASPLVQACHVHDKYKKHGPGELTRIWDVTGGLGQDAWVLAAVPSKRNNQRFYSRLQAATLAAARKAAEQAAAAGGAGGAGIDTGNITAVPPELSEIEMTDRAAEAGLASLTVIEQHPTLYRLLANAVLRAKSNPVLSPVARRMSVVHADSVDYMTHRNPTLTVVADEDRPHVIFIDTFYPDPAGKPKSAPKKTMYFAKRIAKQQTAEELTTGFDALLSVARQVALQKIVVKRPTFAPPAARDVTARLSSRDTRYDIIDVRGSTGSVL